MCEIETNLRIGCLNVIGWYEGKIEDLSLELYEWGMDVMAVNETQLRERVDMCCDRYRMIGNGRSKWMKRGGEGRYSY